jgi:colicin import membrane protein
MKQSRTVQLKTLKAAADAAGVATRNDQQKMEALVNEKKANKETDRAAEVQRAKTEREAQQHEEARKEREQREKECREREKREKERRKKEEQQRCKKALQQRLRLEDEKKRGRTRSS